MTWPLTVFFSSAVAHPFLLICLRVRYSGLENSLGAYNHHHSGLNERTQRNFWQAAKFIYKYEGGIRAFYRGFVPSTIFMMALNYRYLETMIMGVDGE